MTRLLCWCGLHYPRVVLFDGFLVQTWRCCRCGHRGYSAQFEGW